MPTLTLPVSQARAFILARQFISLPADDPLEVPRRLVGVQMQYDASVPVSLWTRSQALPSGWTEDAFLKQRSLVKTWSMRSTVHAHTAGDLPLVIAAIGPAHRKRFYHFWQLYFGKGPEEVDALYAQIRAALAGGPLTRRQLHERVPALQGLPWSGWGVDVKGLAYHGELVFANYKQFALREQWLGPDWQDWTEAGARAELLRRYLRAYGTAAIADYAYWSGQRISEARAQVKALGDELIELRLAGEDIPENGQYLALAADEQALRGPQPEPPPVALLPKFDALVMGWRERWRFEPAGFEDRVHRPAGQVEATVLLRGQITATWRLERQGRQAILQAFPFRPLAPEDQALIEEKMAAWLAYLGLPGRAEVKPAALASDTNPATLKP